MEDKLWEAFAWVPETSSAPGRCYCKVQVLITTTS